MASTSINENVTQIITFDIVETYDVNAKAMKQSLRHLEKQPGWTLIHWARDFNHRCSLHIYIIWTDTYHAEAFAASSSLATVFSAVAISPICSVCIDLRGSVSHQHPTEAVTFYFPSASLDEGNKMLFDRQVQEAVTHLQELHDQEIHVLTTAKGWGKSSTTRNREDAAIYVILISWSGLDGMHDVKRDANSLFNNMFAPLKDVATLGTQTALYINLKLRERKDSGAKCVVS